MTSTSCGILGPAYETITGQPIPTRQPRYSPERPYAGAYGTRPTNAYDVMIRQSEDQMAENAATARMRSSRR